MGSALNPYRLFLFSYRCLRAPGLLAVKRLQSFLWAWILSLWGWMLSLWAWILSLWARICHFGVGFCLFGAGFCHFGVGFCLFGAGFCHFGVGFCLFGAGFCYFGPGFCHRVSFLRLDFVRAHGAGFRHPGFCNFWRLILSFWGWILSPGTNLLKLSGFCFLLTNSCSILTL